jgi:Zn-dependent oligopeptidase
MFHGHYSHSMPFMWLEQSKNNVPSSFHHLFHSATWMYVAGFYSYAWSSELQKTIWDKIQETWWPLESTIMQRYIDCMLSQWARKPSMELFEAVMN